MGALEALKRLFERSIEEWEWFDVPDREAFRADPDQHRNPVDEVVLVEVCHPDGGTFVFSEPCMRARSTVQVQDLNAGENFFRVFDLDAEEELGIRRQFGDEVDLVQQIQVNDGKSHVSANCLQAICGTSNRRCSSDVSAPSRANIGHPSEPVPDPLSVSRADLEQCLRERLLKAHARMRFERSDVMLQLDKLLEHVQTAKPECRTIELLPCLWLWYTTIGCVSEMVVKVTFTLLDEEFRFLAELEKVFGEESPGASRRIQTIWGICWTGSVGVERQVVCDPFFYKLHWWCPLSKVNFDLPCVARFVNP